MAMQWFVEQGRVNEAFRLASSLVAFWMATKRLDEALPGLVGFLRCLVAMMPIADWHCSMPGIWRSGKATTSTLRRSRIKPSSLVVRRMTLQSQLWLWLVGRGSRYERTLRTREDSVVRL